MTRYLEPVFGLSITGYHINMVEQHGGLLEERGPPPCIGIKDSVQAKENATVAILV